MKPVERLCISVSAAKQYGIEEAIVLDKIEGLVRAHKDEPSYHERFVHDGRAWATYSYVGLSRATGDLLSPQQCRRAVARLAEAGALLIGNYSTGGLSNRATWYSTPDALLGSVEIDRSDVSESTDGICRNYTKDVSESTDPTLFNYVPTDLPTISHTAPTNRRVATEPSAKPFETFWRRYIAISNGRPGDIIDAGSEFRRRIEQQPDANERFQVLMAHLEHYAASDQPQEGYVMTAVKFLRQFEQWSEPRHRMARTGPRRPQPGERDPLTGLLVAAV